MIRRLRLLVCFFSAVAAASACKTGTGGGSVKDESDIATKEPEANDRFFIVCRAGRLQNGQKSTHVTKDELKHACEENDPNGGSTGTPPGSGTAAADLSQCANIPDTIRTLNFGFTPAFSAAAAGLAPENARQQLCEVMVPVLKNSLDRDPGLLRFLNGSTTGAHTMVVFDVANAAVRFDPDFLSITVPKQVTPLVVAKMNAEIDLKECRAGGAVGRFVGGSCWYLSAPGTDCDTACTAQQKAYSDESKTFAGSGGVLANCSAVGVAFGNLAGRDSKCPGALNGCVQDTSRLVLRCNAPETTSTGSLASFKRYCACK